VVVWTEGSWEAGVKGARAGRFMTADPMVGAFFKQEDAKHVAEDCTEEFSLLEPGGARQQGLRSRHRPRAGADLQGGNDILKLVSVQGP
jgi:hypothetical protein